jgi:hypothetical protein
MQVRSVLAYWTHGQVITGLNPSKVKKSFIISCSHFMDLLFYILQRPMLGTFLKIFYHTSLYDATLNDVSVTLT